MGNKKPATKAGQNKDKNVEVFGVVTGNSGNLVLWSVASAMLRCRPPHAILGRKDPSNFRINPHWLT
jgi:hypothetical protein